MCPACGVRVPGATRGFENYRVDGDVMPDGFVDLGLGTGGITGIVTGVALVVTVALLVFCAWAGTDELIGAVAIVTGVTTLIAGGLWVGACWPVWDAKYAHVYEVTGEVTSVTNSFTQDGGEYSRTPVVTVAGVDMPLVVNDPRAVELEGKTARFVCSPKFVYMGADRYECQVG